MQLITHHPWFTWQKLYYTLSNATRIYVVMHGTGQVNQRQFSFTITSNMDNNVP